MKKIVLIGLMLALFATTLIAQQKGRVSGIVRDAESGETLIGVAVYEAKLKAGVTTDEKGAYELELPMGNHLLQFSYIGFQSVEKNITIGQKPQTLNVRLEPEVTRLNEVQITSQKPDRNVSEMAMSVQSLDMITIKKIPALMGEVDVIKTIQLLPGVQAASEGSSGFSVRGGPKPHSARRSPHL